jgi:hypothetical protein
LPVELFKSNYLLHLGELKMHSEPLTLKYFISRPSTKSTFAGLGV